jgi:hypothetical protein
MIKTFLPKKFNNSNVFTITYKTAKKRSYALHCNRICLICFDFSSFEIYLINRVSKAIISCCDEGLYKVKLAKDDFINVYKKYLPNMQELK